MIGYAVVDIIERVVRYKGFRDRGINMIYELGL